MKLTDFIFEVEKLSLTKNKWMWLDPAEKSQASQELIGLVDTAYDKTLMGSFVKNNSDVGKSDWLVLDWDHDPDIDATIFYRGPRASEQWQGFKIQGIGHDGQKNSKNKLMDQVIKTLSQPGWWIEASGALRKILLNNTCPVVTDADTIQRLFNDETIKLNNTFGYKRKLAGGVSDTESVFGHPII